MNEINPILDERGRTTCRGLDCPAWTDMEDSCGEGWCLAMVDGNDWMGVGYDQTCTPGLWRAMDEREATAGRLMEEAEKYKAERDEARRELDLVHRGLRCSTTM